MSNLSNFDVVIVGGGPSGSSAAITAAKTGLSVCLLDKSVFPRDKLCGGVVTPRSRVVFESVFGNVWRNDLFRESSNIAFIAGDKTLAKLTNYLKLYFTMRKDFDFYLLTLAEKEGAEIRQGVSVDSIDLSARMLTTSNGDKVSFKTLIGCDGVNSVVAKHLFGQSFNSETIGFGLEVEVPITAEFGQSDLVEIDFAGPNWGYGWMFPKQESVTIGVGGIHRLNADMKDHLTRYLSRKKLDVSKLKVKGQYIPFGDYRKVPGRGSVLLCGDAAGIVDPITGEGIAYAMQSGHAAANAACKAISNNLAESALSIYLPEYRKVIKDIARANLWRWFIFPKLIQGTFSWAFADAGTLQRGYLDILAGTKSYSDLPALFFEQVREAVKKVAKKLLGS